MTSRPLFARLIVVFAVLLAMIVAVCGGVIYVSGQRSVRAQQVADLQRLTPLIRGWLAEDGVSKPPVHDLLRRRLFDAAKVLDTRITLVAGDGTTFFDTHADPAVMTNHNERPEVVAARKQGSASIERHSQTIDEDSIYVAEVLDPEHPEGMVVRASFPRRASAPVQSTSPSPSTNARQNAPGHL